MQIPHSISLLEVEDLLCVADRGNFPFLAATSTSVSHDHRITVIFCGFIENGRILCYNAGLNSYRQAGQLLFEVQHAEIHKLYAIAHIGNVCFPQSNCSDR